MVYGWVHDPDNLNTSVSKLWLHVRDGAARNKRVLAYNEVSITNLNYRVNQINDFLSGQGLAKGNGYGWRTSFTGLKQSASPTYELTGLTINANKGYNNTLGINSYGGVDGSNKPYFLSGRIPNACLAP